MLLYAATFVLWHIYMQGTTIYMNNHLNNTMVMVMSILGFEITPLIYLKVSNVFLYNTHICITCLTVDYDNTNVPLPS